MPEDFPCYAGFTDISWYAMSQPKLFYSSNGARRKTEEVGECYEKNMLMIESIHITKLVFLSCCFLSFHFTQNLNTDETFRPESGCEASCFPN